MYSWWLYRALNVFNDSPLKRHPVYKHERRHLMAQTNVFDRGIRAAVIVGSTLMFMLALWASDSLNPTILCLLPFCWFGPMVVVLPLMPLWVLPISIVVAPVVAQNRVRHTWDLLRITAVDPRDLLLALTRASVERLRGLLMWLLMALIPLGMIVGTGFAEAVLFKLEDRAISTDGLTPLFLGAVLWLFGVIVIIVDRVQQLLMMCVGALAGGTFAGRSMRSAMLSGAVWALALWVAEIGTTALVVIVTPGLRVDKSFDIALSVLIGPLPSYLVALPVEWALLAMLLTLLAREAAIRLLWQSALRAARV